MAVQQWVKELVESVTGPSQMEVGKTLRHPDGRTVLITGGRLWGEHGISNFWRWREVFDDGSIAIKEESGYGW